MDRRLDPPEHAYCDTCDNKFPIEDIDGYTCTWCIEQREEEDEQLEW